MHKTNFNEQRFYELIPVVRQPGRTFLECCATRALKERVKTLDSLNNDAQVLLIAGGRKDYKWCWRTRENLHLKLILDN